MFQRHAITPEKFAARFVELLPEYLPGVDTGAFEATDRRRCWNKTLNAVLTVIGNNLGGLQSLFFCTGIYLVALFFSIFICSSVFYAFNPKRSAAQTTASANVIMSKPLVAGR